MNKYIFNIFKDLKDLKDIKDSKDIKDLKPEMSVIWEAPRPFITYPALKALEPVNFKWTDICDAYNTDLPAGADKLYPLRRAEGGFYAAANPEDNTNDRIRQLRQVGGIFTPLGHRGLYKEELERLSAVLNRIAGRFEIISFKLN
jgi:hypothetical protein